MWRPQPPVPEFRIVQAQHCHSYVNITTTSQSYVRVPSPATLKSEVITSTKWQSCVNNSEVMVMTIITTTPVMETFMPTTADVWIWHLACRSSWTLAAHHHRATEDRFITLQNYDTTNTTIGKCEFCDYSLSYGNITTSQCHVNANTTITVELCEFHAQVLVLSELHHHCPQDLWITIPVPHNYANTMTK